MNNIRHFLMSSTALMLFGGIVSPAAAAEVEKTMSVSGHINRAVVVSDDGKSTTVGQIDNTEVAGSRFRIDAAAKSESMTISAWTEVGVQANGALSSKADSSTTSLNLRHSAISVANTMGTLVVGHTSTADDGFLGNNLSGAGNAGFYDGTTIGGETMHVSGATGTTTGPSVTSIMQFFDGGRSSNVKYTTPKMGGFTGVVGHSDSDHGSARLNYAANYDGTKVAASAGWGSRGATSSIDNEWGGSMAVSLTGGLNGSIAYSKSNLNGNVAANTGLADPEMWGVSLGYTMGMNGISAWYQNVQDLGANGNEAKTYALVAEHKMPDYGAAIYGGIQNVEYDVTGTNYDDLTAGWVGIRVAF